MKKSGGRGAFAEEEKHHLKLDNFLTLSADEDKDEEVLSIDLEEEAKETLARMAPKFKQTHNYHHHGASDSETMQWQRFQEERRGLLTEEVHLDKYP